MSKKNNKARDKAYADGLKEEERLREEKRLKKIEEKDTNRISQNILEDINSMAIVEEVPEKMDIEPTVSKKKKKFKKKFKA